MSVPLIFFSSWCLTIAGILISGLLPSRSVEAPFNRYRMS